jgi:tetratricopeptide (TPR) repeat protein
MKRFLTSAALILLLLPLAGCNQVKARAKFREGNSEYRNESYVKALEKFQEGLELDPSSSQVWRSVGLAALALYKPGVETAQNKEYGEVAGQAFQNYLKDYPDDSKIREYLLTTLVNTKQYDEALAYLDKRAQEAPAEANDIRNLKISILTQSGRLEEAWRIVQQGSGPGQAESFFRVAATAWNESYNNPSLDSVTRAKYVDLGLEAVDRAVKAKKDYFEAMVYYNLLYREKAKLQTDANLRAEYTAKAEDWRGRAQVLRQRMLEAEKKAAANAPKPAA